MLKYVIKRILWMIPILILISFFSFVIIQLPPGDYLTSYISSLAASGEQVSLERIEALRSQYDLDRPFFVQYLNWIGRFVCGDMGLSFEWNQPVRELIGERLLLTMLSAVLSLLTTWAFAIPVGIFSAGRKYSVYDYILTFIGFIGIATPGFLLAMIALYSALRFFGVSAEGLFSVEFQNAPWSFARLIDLVKHIWLPVFILSFNTAAISLRIMRGNLLDEIAKNYVITARAKGLRYWRVIVKYPVRIALIPIVSTVGWLIPQIISQGIVVEIVLGLPTLGPILFNSLLNQDMFLAGSIIMLLSILTVIGTLVSDLLLIMLDPRISFEKTEN